MSLATCQSLLSGSFCDLLDIIDGFKSDYRKTCISSLL